MADKLAFRLFMAAAVLALAGCALLKGPAAGPTTPALHMGRMIASSSDRTPVTMVLPAYNAQGARVAETRDWSYSAAPVTRIRFLGVGAGTNAQPARTNNNQKSRVQTAPRHKLAAQRKPVTRRKPVLRVFFSTNSALVPHPARTALTKLRAGPTGYCLVGHADPRGTWAHNLRLSSRRALAVSAWIHGKVETEAFGEFDVSHKLARYKFDRRADVFRGHCQLPHTEHAPGHRRIMRQAFQPARRWWGAVATSPPIDSRMEATVLAKLHVGERREPESSRG